MRVEGIPLDDMPIAKQRAIARTIIKQKRQSTPGPTSTSTIPDALIDAILADPDARARLNEITMKTVGIALDDMPVERQREIVRMILANG